MHPPAYPDDHHKQKRHEDDEDGTGVARSALASSQHARITAAAQDLLVEGARVGRRPRRHRSVVGGQWNWWCCRWRQRPEMPEAVARRRRVVEGAKELLAERPYAVRLLQPQRHLD